MNYFSIVLEQVEIFVVYLLIGIIAVKTNVLNREKLGALSSCVTKILLPLLIFSNAINGATKEQFLSSTVILLLTAVYYLVLYLVTAALSKLLHLDIQHRNLYRACSMFGNCGFMGIPIILALYPEQRNLYRRIHGDRPARALDHRIRPDLPAGQPNFCFTLKTADKNG